MYISINMSKVFRITLDVDKEYLIPVHVCDLLHKESG